MNGTPRESDGMYSFRRALCPFCPLFSGTPTRGRGAAFLARTRRGSSWVHPCGSATLGLKAARQTKPHAWLARKRPYPLLSSNRFLAPPLFCWSDGPIIKVSVPGVPKRKSCFFARFIARARKKLPSTLYQVGADIDRQQRKACVNQHSCVYPFRVQFLF